MPEGLVYVCKWKKLGSGECSGVLSRLNLRAKAATLDILRAKLAEAIARANGDFEPVIEFEPPEALGGKVEWFQDEIVVLCPNSHFTFDNVDHIIDGNFCRRCKYTRDGRTKEAISVRSMWPGNASFSWDPDAEGVRVLLVSEKLLEAFSKEDRASFGIRAVTMPKRTRKSFVEIVPKKFVREVAIKSLDVSGWHCNACGYVVFGHGLTLGWGVPVISRDSLPDHALFFIGTSADYHLCMKPKLWQTMKPILRKASFSSERVAVVETSEIAKKIVVPEFEEARRRKS